MEYPSLWFSRKLGRAAQPAQQRTPAPCRGWHAYVQEQKRGTKRSMADIGREWQAMGDEQRRPYYQPRGPQQNPAEAQAARPAQPGVAGSSIFPHSGDDFYPISAVELGDLPKHVAALSKLWSRTVGDGVVTPAPRFEAPVRHLCEETYGRARCATDIDDAAKARLSILRRSLRSWAVHRHPKPCRYDQVWTALGMLYFGPKANAAGGSGGVAPGRVALLVYPELGPLELVFCVQPSLAVQPGDLVTMDLQLEQMANLAKITRSPRAYANVRNGQPNAFVNGWQAGCVFNRFSEFRFLSRFATVGVGVTKASGCALRFYLIPPQDDGFPVPKPGRELHRL